jgi:hypothetical protein
LYAFLISRIKYIQIRMHFLFTQIGPWLCLQGLTLMVLFQHPSETIKYLGQKSRLPDQTSNSRPTKWKTNILTTQFCLIARCSSHLIQASVKHTLTSTHTHPSPFNLSRLHFHPCHFVRPSTSSTVDTALIQLSVAQKLCKGCGPSICCVRRSE